jgi:hypothetical protein
MRLAPVVALLAMGGATRSAAQTPVQPGRSDLPAVLAEADRVPVRPIEAEMRNVNFHVDDRVVLRIRRLRGLLRPTSPTAPPWFDDPASFTLAIDSGDVGITPASLGALLNGYVFNYPGSPLKRLRISIEKGELVQRGVLHKVIDLPFSIRAKLSATPDGRLRLHPTSVRVIGIPVRGMMRFFGLELDNLVRIKGGRGIEIEGNDFLLAPSGLLPSPKISGRVRAVRLEADEIRQVFGGSNRRGRIPELQPTDTSAKNYMFYRGGVLRFGKLTMADADLQIVDADPRDPFEFYLARLNDQLVAGESHNQPDFGLVTTMPDYDDTARKK